MKFGDFTKIKSLQTPAGFMQHLQQQGITMPCDTTLQVGADAPLAQPCEVQGLRIGNRWAIQPMEGWDGTAEGQPTEHTHRRWQHFGESGAKLIWGGEAVAVRHDGRANPRQLVLNANNQASIAGLRETLVQAHRQSFGSDQGLVIGLQLTHSGRFCKPDSQTQMAPQILYRHPLLDRKFGLNNNHPVMTDEAIAQLIDDYIIAAKRAWDCGFQFVDLKHCHGYLGHEFLSAVDRPGPYGGPFENRTRFLRELCAGIRAEVPQLHIAVRFSAVDFVPFQPDPTYPDTDVLGPGVPEDITQHSPYRYAFGAHPLAPTHIDLRESLQLLGLLEQLNIRLVNITLGSPYYNPHLTRPALYPPSDGYQPPEDPLLGVMRHLHVVRDLKRAFPQLTFMGSGYSYLQEFLPYVAQAVVREGWTDLVGLGRMVLSYHDLPADVLRGRALQTKRLCRTFSDCTTAPRNALISGCYPLDTHYKKSPAMIELTQIKKQAKLA